MQKRFHTLLAPENRGGNLRPAAGASVTVTDPNGALATIYSDNGVTAAANPLTSSATGYYEYYAADGRYTETIVKAGRDTVTIRDILLEDPADSPSPTTADIASTADSKGAGLVGFLYSAVYAAGTLGKWLQDLATSAGAALVGFIQSGADAVERTVADKLREHVTYRDFGAAGDGVTDDYAALQAAINYCKSSGIMLRHTGGVYLTSQRLDFTVGNSESLTILGDGFGKSIIRKTAANTDAIMRVGSPSATSFTSNVNLRGFTLEGNGTATTSAGLELYDVVQSVFRIRARLCGAGVHSYGGIDLDFSGSDLSNNLKGALIEKFTSLAGGGWPNIFNFQNTAIKNNSQHGIYFDHGRVLNIGGADIETNGTSGDATTGGIWIGPNIGQESGLLSPGLCMGGGNWLEANAGRGALVFESGRNSVKDTYFVANANATNDVYVSGGRYSLQDCDFDTNKAANILETAGVLSGNYILNCDYNAATIDAAKTVVLNASGLQNVAISATTLTATGQTSLGGAAGAEAFRAKTQAGAVNRVFAKGGATGAPAQFGVEGEANASFYGVVAGVGIWQFTTGGGAYEQVRIINVTGADRAIILGGGTTDAYLSSTAGGIQFGAIPKLPSYTIATLPAASGNTKGMIYVSDGAANKRLAISDGANWRWPDGAVVS